MIPSLKSLQSKGHSPNSFSFTAERVCGESKSESWRNRERERERLREGKRRRGWWLESI